MKTTIFKGRDFLSEVDFTLEEIETILEVAFELKKDRLMGRYHDFLLRSKTLFMIFYNLSLRTRNSFEAGMTQLGGHAHYLDASKIYLPAMEGKDAAFSTERVKDVARVLSRMGNAISIRCFGEPVNWEYGEAHKMLREFAHFADIPVINMEDDIYHPFQGIADMLTVKEKFGGFKGVNFTMSWAYSPSIYKPRAVPQSAILLATRLGCNVTLAHPKEMELDPDILAKCEEYASIAGTRFQITEEFEDAVKEAHVVYAKSWAPFVLFKPPVGQDDKKQAEEIFSRYKNWKVTSRIMESAAKNAVYMHCLPADRNWEVDDEVMDKLSGSGWLSAIYDQAENRLHGQKAVMSLVM